MERQLQEMQERLKLLEHKLYQLRVQILWLRIVLIVILAIGWLPYLLAMQNQIATYSVVRAERFEVTHTGEVIGFIGSHSTLLKPNLSIFNREGKPIAEFSDNGLAVFNNEGKIAIGIYGFSDGGNLCVYDLNMKPIIMFSARSKDGNLCIYDREGNLFAKFSANSEGGDLSIYGKEGKPSVKIATNPEGGALSILNREGKPLVNLTAALSHSGLIISNKEGKNVVTLSGDLDGGKLSIANREGKLVLELSALPYGGKIEISRPGDKKSAAVAIGVVANGSGSITTTDAFGGILWSSPIR